MSRQQLSTYVDVGFLKIVFTVFVEALPFASFRLRTDTQCSGEFLIAAKWQVLAAEVDGVVTRHDYFGVYKNLMFTKKCLYTKSIQVYRNIHLCKIYTKLNQNIYKYTGKYIHTKCIYNVYFSYKIYILYAKYTCIQKNRKRVYTKQI